MVSAMASAYNGLTEEERQRVFLLAVGLDRLKGNDQNFCQGFAACPDDGASSWWTGWNVNQRDVFFFTKQADGSWEYYCRYSMNTNRNEFGETIQEMLDVVETDLGPAQAIGDSSPSYVSSSSSKANHAIFATMSAAVLGWSML